MIQDKYLETDKIATKNKIEVKTIIIRLEKMVSHFYFRSQYLKNILKFKENGLVKCFLSHGDAPAAGFWSDSFRSWMRQTHRVPAAVSSLPFWWRARVDGLLGLFLRSNKNKYETTDAALAQNLLPLWSNRMWQCWRWSQSETHSAPFCWLTEMI